MIFFIYTECGVYLTSYVVVRTLIPRIFVTCKTIPVVYVETSRSILYLNIRSEEGEYRNYFRLTKTRFSRAVCLMAYALCCAGLDFWPWQKYATSLCDTIVRSLRYENFTMMTPSSLRRRRGECILAHRVGAILIWRHDAIKTESYRPARVRGA